MNMDKMIEKTENNLQDAVTKAKDITSEASSEMAQSGKEWVNYIQQHPVQSVLFGIVAFFALKGMIKG